MIAMKVSWWKEIYWSKFGSNGFNTWEARITWVTLTNSWARSSIQDKENFSNLSLNLLDCKKKKASFPSLMKKHLRNLIYQRVSKMIMQGSWPSKERENSQKLQSLSKTFFWDESNSILKSGRNVWKKERTSFAKNSFKDYVRKIERERRKHLRNGETFCRIHISIR